MTGGVAAPAVSVVIPTHNSGSLLVRALESVYSQTFSDFEIIVVDDASTDDTSERIKPHLPRVCYLVQEHAGSAVARNRGILHARGKYIAFLDSDDFWMPQKLEKQMQLAGLHTEATLIYADFYRGETENCAQTSGLASRKHWVQGDEFRSLLRQNFLHTSSVLVKKEALADAGIFDPRLTNAQDWDLWIRLAAAGEFRFVPEVLSCYWIHPDQSVKTTKYLRNLVYADEVVMGRWGGDEVAQVPIMEKLREDLWVLGRREWKSGNFKNARAAYWRCARLGGRRSQSLSRAALCCLPSGILERIR